MNLFKKKHLLTAVALFSMPLPKFAAAEDSLPIEAHVCNNILEFAQEKNVGVEILKLNTLFNHQGKLIQHHKNLSSFFLELEKRELALETYVFYGKCLVLNSTDPLEKERGGAILRAMSDKLNNYPSAFFLAQYIEMDENSTLQSRISAYENVIYPLNILVKDSSWYMRLARTVDFVFGSAKGVTHALLRLDEYKMGSLSSRINFTHLISPLSSSLFVNSINKDWWLREEMAYYKVPQLHLISMIEQLKKLPLDEIPEETSIRNGQAEPWLPIHPAKQIIENSLPNIIGSAENCMSALENYPRLKDEEDIIDSIHSACEELRELALDFSNGSRPMTLEEAENLVLTFLQSQEERFLPVHSLDLSAF